MNSLLFDTVSRHATVADGEQVALQLSEEVGVVHANVEQHSVVALDEADAERAGRELRIRRQTLVQARKIIGYIRIVSLSYIVIVYNDTYTKIK